MTAKSPKQSEPQLPDLPLPADQDVTGGFCLLTSLQQMQHETARSVISNVRA